RLLKRDDSGQLTFSEFSDDNVPRYAILSHTWGDEKVTYEDIKNSTGNNKPGYEKIQFCKAQPKPDGLQYLWIDSVCV
ncbi:hypothetical protein BKA63DRAFT_394646, partial [Paraphoma chrysanthemicola]